ncbi:MAG: hypothetical protein R3263_11325, partial [Myxococcota bacterium]|nr:hypothetical protein [Myxococcota bacterium]
ASVPEPASPTPHAEPARYELRVFGARLSRVAARMRRRGRDEGVDVQHKLYLLGRRADVNLKVREGRLEVKRRVGRRGALERWAAEPAQPLPLDPDWARAALPALLGVPALPPLPEAPLSLRDLVLRVVLPLPHLDVCSVHAQRRRFALGAGVRAEHGEARVSGLRIGTAAVEGVDAEAVRRAALLVGLDPAANTSWPAALRELRFAPDGLVAETPEMPHGASA